MIYCFAVNHFAVFFIIVQSHFYPIFSCLVPVPEYLDTFFLFG